MSVFSLIFILTFGSGTFSKSCSRVQSKFVREYFARSLLPLYQKYSQPIPEKCPFSPLRDMYHYHENNKTKLDTYRWKCEICGKLFAKELHLDNHFDNRHINTIQTDKNSVCLADYCRIFRCNVFTNKKNDNTQCYESTMNILRNKCVEHIDLCVPKSASLSIQNKLTIELRENLCSFLTCSRINDPPDYMKKGSSFLQIFAILFVVVLSIIAYVVINYTDLIFDENELVGLEKKLDNLETLGKKLKTNEPTDDKIKEQIRFNETENLRQRRKNDKF